MDTPERRRGEAPGDEAVAMPKTRRSTLTHTHTYKQTEAGKANKRETWWDEWKQGCQGDAPEADRGILTSLLGRGNIKQGKRTGRQDQGRFRMQTWEENVLDVTSCFGRNKNLWQNEAIFICVRLECVYTFCRKPWVITSTKKWWAVNMLDAENRMFKPTGSVKLYFCYMIKTCIYLIE